MKSSRLAGLITLIMLLCTFGTVAAQKYGDNGAPQAAHGVIDLSGWSFAAGGPVKLER
ncbi:hypothetical protein LJK88_15385 [Paenibacillus sp. P26]|nr:hypothetical protein LJK88_15385 [Paenibacillus sp. P26]